MIVAFYGEMTVWIRKPDAAGWHFPTSGRKAGETILEVAVRYLTPKSTTAYVYMCEVSHLSWWYEAPDREKVAEMGIFRGAPAPLASTSVELVLDAALRARRTGLR